MMKTGLGKLVVVLLLLALVFSFTCFTQQTITVPDDYPTIQAAIDAAQPGDTVYVKAGRYIENLTITRPLNLVGEDRTKVIIQSEGLDQDVIALGLSEGEAVITGVLVTGGRCGICVVVAAGAQADLVDITSYRNQVGVYAAGNGEFSLARSYLIHSDTSGLWLRGITAYLGETEVLYGGAGILLMGDDGVVLENNLIGLCLRGIDTYTTDCGWDAEEDGYGGNVTGMNNRVFGLGTDLCPEYPGAPWPDSFVDLAWRSVVDEALAAYDLGVELDRGQDTQGALTAYTDALGFLDGVSFPLLAALVEARSGCVYIDLGRYEDALAECETARAVFKSYGMEVEVAHIDANIGNVCSRLSRYEDALAKYAIARAVYECYDIEVDVATIDQNIGVVYLGLGRYEDALAKYEAARAVFQSHDMEVEVADVDTNIGVVYFVTGQYEDALATYQSARAMYATHGTEVDIAEVDTNIGNVYAKFGWYEDALALYEVARAVFDTHGMEFYVAELEVNIGSMYQNLGRYEEALNAYQSARERYEKCNIEIAVAELETNIGNTYAERGRGEDALASYQEALGILNEVSPAAGMAYSYPVTRWQILENKGRCHADLSQWDEAREAYEDSIAVIESLRGYMKSEELKTAWQERTKDVYERLIDLLYRMGQGASAFTYAERCRARTFLDALYQGSIAPDQLISPEAGISSGAVDPKAIDQAVADARDSLQENEAVLEYMVTDHGVYLWVITKEGIGDPIFIEYERAQLMNDVITLRKTLESDTPDPIVLTELLTSFYDILIKPGLSELNDKVDTLILIPSGPLWYLPFSALKMSDKEVRAELGTTRHPYLVEKFTLAYLPSLASLSSLTKGEAEAAGGVRLLALADPELSPEQLRKGEGSKCGEEKPLGRYEQLVAACQAFADLLVGEEQEEQCVYAGREAQEVRAHVDTGRQVVVYAAHGQFNPYVPLQSKLLLASGGEAANPQTDSRVLDGNYHAWEALLTDYRGTELVILAACETLLPHLKDMQGTLAVLADQECDQVELTPQQLEQIVVGDEVVGLARAFLSSGAEAVLGTLWLANPTAIGELLTSMADYHKNEGDTWVQALTKAQRELIEGNTFKNPWFWAPYQLIGRWR
jgi:CHAT domain-containing protein